MCRLTVLLFLVALPALLLAACGDDDADVQQLQLDVQVLQAQVDVLTRELEIAQDARDDLAEDVDDLEDARVDLVRESAATAHAASAAADTAASAADAAAGALAEAAAAGAAAETAAETAATAGVAIEIADQAAGDVEDVEGRLERALEELAAALTWIAQLSERVDAAADDAATRDAALTELWSAVDDLAVQHDTSQQDVWAAVDDLWAAIDDIRDRLDLALDGLAVPIRSYFQELDALARASDDAVQEIADAWIRTLEAGDLSAAKEHFQDLVAVKTEFSMSIVTLDPPPAVAARHAALVEGAELLAAALAALERRLASAATIEEYQRISETFGESPGFQVTYERYEDACFSLQDLADAAGLDADLRCDAL